MKIEFVRETRDCPFNEGQTNPRLLINDYAVLIDGERRATWQRTGKEYWLHDEDGERILRPPLTPGNERWADITKANQKEFAAVIEEYLQLGKIPTAEQYANRKRAREEEARLEAEERAAKAVRDKKREAAEELYNALKVVALDPKISAWLRKNDPKAFEQIEVAIELAEGGAQ